MIEVAQGQLDEIDRRFNGSQGRLSLHLKAVGAAALLAGVGLSMRRLTSEGSKNQGIQELGKKTTVVGGLLATTFMAGAIIDVTHTIRTGLRAVNEARKGIYG